MAMDPPQYVHAKVLDNDNQVRDFYHEERDIGQGMFGRTVLVTDVNDPVKCYAMKIQPKVRTTARQPERDTLRLLKELLILDRILPRHPNIIEIKDLLITPDFVYIVQELCEGRTLLQFYPLADNTSARRAFGQLADAVHTCHQYGVAHCDIKSDNVLFLDPERMQLKLIDFGVAVYRQDWVLKRYNDFNPLHWFLPEELEPTSTFTRFRDSRMLGKTLHCIMVGRFVPAVYSNYAQETMTRFRIRTERFDPAALDLLTKIGPPPIGPDEDHELWTLDQICKHPWLTGLPLIPMQPAEQHRTLNEEFTLMRNDLTVIKRLLREWMVTPITIVTDYELGLHFEIMENLRRGAEVTRILEVEDTRTRTNLRAMKLIYAKIRDTPATVHGGYETRPPIMIYLELLITLRILPPHEHIVSIRHIYVHREYVALIRELLWRRNTLEDFFVTAAEGSARIIFRQMVETVHFMHRYGVVHMDLHPSHFAFKTNTFSHIKLVSFSRALYVPSLAVLKHENFQPEKYCTREFANMATYANVQVDITALGRILHAMLVRKWEPDPAKCGELWPNLGDYSPDALSLLSKIGPHPHGPAEQNRTITIERILRHPWLQR